MFLQTMVALASTTHAGLEICVLCTMTRPACTMKTCNLFLKRTNLATLYRSHNLITPRRIHSSGHASCLRLGLQHPRFHPPCLYRLPRLLRRPCHPHSPQLLHQLLQLQTIRIFTYSLVLALVLLRSCVPGDGGSQYFYTPACRQKQSHITRSYQCLPLTDPSS